jgi:hypothetical protein
MPGTRFMPGPAKPDPGAGHDDVKLCAFDFKSTSPNFGQALSALLFGRRGRALVSSAFALTGFGRQAPPFIKKNEGWSAGRRLILQPCPFEQGRPLAKDARLPALHCGVALRLLGRNTGPRSALPGTSDPAGVTRVVQSQSSELLAERS